MIILAGIYIIDITDKQVKRQLILQEVERVL